MGGAGADGSARTAWRVQSGSIELSAGVPGKGPPTPVVLFCQLQSSLFSVT